MNSSEEGFVIVSFPPHFDAFCLSLVKAPATMKSQCFLALTALLTSGCAQVNGQFYTKKDFTSQSFVADSSECKRQNPSFVAIRGYVADNKDRASYLDDAMVRDCMKAKGYNIQLETK